MISQAVRIALPLGDPNGIGPEIALKTAAAYAGRPDVCLTLFGPQVVLQQTAQCLGLTDLLAATPVVFTAAMPTGTFQPGRVCAEAGSAMISAASSAITATRRGDFDAVVAGPHHETAVHLAGIPFSGYPSLVASVCGQPEDSVFLLLVGGGLHIVHATLHESVQHALDRLTSELVVQAALAGMRAMRVPGRYISGYILTHRPSVCSASIRMQVKTACSEMRTSASPSRPPNACAPSAYR